MEQRIDNEMVPFVTDYVPYLDDDETEDGEVKIGFSKEPDGKDGVRFTFRM